MVSRILTTLLITSLALASLAKDYQIACKSNVNLLVTTASMETSLWTNSCFWNPAESPIVNPLTNDARWICYAKNCGTNGTQSTVSKQPLRTNINFVVADKFDGTDDVIIIGNPATLQINAASGVTISCWVKVNRHKDYNSILGSGYLAAGSTGYGLFSTTTNGSWAFAVRSNAVLSTVLALHTNSLDWTHLVGVRSDGISSLYLNGVLSGLDTNYVSTSIIPSARWGVGARDSAGTFAFNADAYIASPAVFNRRLSSNEVFSLYNSSKGYFGK